MIFKKIIEGFKNLLTKVKISPITVSAGVSTHKVITNSRTRTITETETKRGITATVLPPEKRSTLNEKEQNRSYIGVSPAS